MVRSGGTAQDAGMSAAVASRQKGASDELQAAVAARVAQEVARMALEGVRVRPRVWAPLNGDPTCSFRLQSTLQMRLQCRQRVRRLRWPQGMPRGRQCCRPLPGLTSEPDTSLRPMPSLSLGQSRSLILRQSLRQSLRLSLHSMSHSVTLKAGGSLEEVARVAFEASVEMGATDEAAATVAGETVGRARLVLGATKEEAATAAGDAVRAHGGSPGAQGEAQSQPKPKSEPVP